tara:strand:- start:212 stop:379 length:168 start_codon:yes stop_codon:yes gene_type:complete
VPVVKAEASQVETDQAPELEAIEVGVVAPVEVKALPVVRVLRALRVLAVRVLLKN